ncbi:hypothetical protein GH733_017237 [Mirounga leonina]|nr:hypothetical protein GH733_017237 [Mirounga leonina]
MQVNPQDPEHRTGHSAEGPRAGGDKGLDIKDHHVQKSYCSLPSWRSPSPVCTDSNRKTKSCHSTGNVGCTDLPLPIADQTTSPLAMAPHSACADRVAQQVLRMRTEDLWYAQLLSGPQPAVLCSSLHQRGGGGYDSTRGKFHGIVKAENGKLIINGNSISIFQE